MAKPKIRNLPDLSYLACPGSEIPVRVTPKATRTSLIYDGETLRATVTAPPVDGKANDATRTLLAGAMGVAPSRLKLKRGQTSRNKVFVYSDD